MKIAIFSDPHLGYQRFEEDSYIQAQRTIEDANEKADLVICAGDIFDVKIPKLETLKRAIDIFNKAKKPIIAIHGNHERRTKDSVNPVQLLQSATKIKILHGDSTVFEHNGEKVQVFGLGSVPEEYAAKALEKTLEKFVPDKEAVRILVLHQSIKELMPDAEEEISLDYLESLPFDLIINGHIHESVTKLDGRFIIPGSTVITQLKKEQMKSRGYILYDSKTKKSEFVDIKSRKFFYEELSFDCANRDEIRSRVKARVEEIRKNDPGAIIAIKLLGKMKEGMKSSDLAVDEYVDVYIDNKFEEGDLKTKLEKLKFFREENLGAKDVAIKELVKKLEGKITLDSRELFEKLLIGVDETVEYLERKE